VFPYLVDLRKDVARLYVLDPYSLTQSFILLCPYLDTASLARHLSVSYSVYILDYFFY
jgi:hypothetical protein